MPPRKSASAGARTASAASTSAVKAAPKTALDAVDAIVAKVSDSLDLLYEPNPELATEATAALGSLYDWARKVEPRSLAVSSALPTLLVDGFNSEQIWEQLKLWVDPVAPNGERALSRYMRYVEQSSDDEDDGANSKSKAKAAATAAKGKNLSTPEHDDDDDDDVDSDDAMAAAVKRLRNKGGKADAAAAAKPASKAKAAAKPAAAKGKAAAPAKKAAKKSAAVEALEADGFFNFADMERFADLGEAEAAFADGEEVPFTDEDILQMKREQRQRRRELKAEAGSDVSDLSADEDDSNGENEDDEADDEDDVNYFKDVKGAGDIMFDDFFLPVNNKSKSSKSHDSDDDAENEEEDAMAGFDEFDAAMGEGDLEGDMEGDDAFAGMYEGDADNNEAAYLSALGGDSDEDGEIDEDEEEEEVKHSQKKLRSVARSLMGDDDDEDDDDGEDDDGKENGSTGKKEGVFDPNGVNEQDSTKFAQIDDKEHVADHLLSSYGKKQKAMAAQIAAIEQELVGPKKWDMVGETQAHKRSKDELLGKDLVVDYASRPTEAITEEVTNEIEAIIRQRCKDGAWDDVQPRVPLAEKAFKPREEVSAEKSQFGLAEIYERDYLQLATQGTGEVESKLNAAHEEISQLFGALCHKLDALSNFHFTPKGRGVELQVTSSTPAVAMEEVLPMAVSSAERAAPQEVFQAASHGLLAVRDEQSRDEKTAARKQRRDAKRKHFDTEAERDKRAALAGDEDAKQRIEVKDLNQTYKKATKSKLVQRGVKEDKLKYASSGAVFTKITDTVMRERAGIPLKKVDKGTSKGASTYMQ